MPEPRTIYPVPGRLLRDPVTGAPVPPEGRTIRRNMGYWLRALRDGDITETPPAELQPATPPTGPQGQED